MMNGSSLFFYLLAGFILGTAVLAVSTRKIFRSAIWLLFSLVGIAGLFLWMQAEFIAAVQIVVYVGGIVVLIIFSIFLTQQTGTEMPRSGKIRRIFSMLAAVFGFALTYNLVHSHLFKQEASKIFQLNVSDLGTQMLGTSEHGYALPFELVSILLLAAMVGCIVIAMKSKAKD
jgi:NADH-quinone oxidoreductase subunit J